MLTFPSRPPVTLHSVARVSPQFVLQQTYQRVKLASVRGVAAQPLRKALQPKPLHFLGVDGLVAHYLAEHPQEVRGMKAEARQLIEADRASDDRSFAFSWENRAWPWFETQFGNDYTQGFRRGWELTLPSPPSRPTWGQRFHDGWDDGMLLQALCLQAGLGVAIL